MNFADRKGQTPEAETGAGPVRLNLGCGGNPLPGYINVDMDTLEGIRARYPDKQFADDIVVRQFDIFDLPYPDNSVDEVRADSMVEHLDFFEEPRFFHEAKRVLKVGGALVISVPDFEELCRLWLAASDDWREFFRNDDEAIRQEHWFGTYSAAMDNRWGYLITTFFGNQNGRGMYHRNAYSEGKVRAIARRLGFTVATCRRFRWKSDRDPMLYFELIKMPAA